jgi:elongation factor P--beta-lysine ligase
MKTWQLLKKNPELFPRYFVKEYIIKATRKFFEERNYHELESPILSAALPQERYIDVIAANLDERKIGYLIPTTERFNKIALAAGLGEHFVITKVCRGINEIGLNHSPEFTMLEWYHLDADYFDIMNDTEELVKYIKNYLDSKFINTQPSPNWLVGERIFYNGVEIDISSPWERISVPEALEKYSKVTLEEIITLEQIKLVAQSKGYKIDENDDWQTIFELIFATEIESQFKIDKPTFVYDYPKILCPLTKENKNNPLVCEKVELYIAGKEIANGYTELLDGREQEKRFREEQKARKELGKPEVNFDNELVEALKSGMPEVAGIGMGLDRLAMIMANANNIAEINLFPAIEMFGEEENRK